MKKIISAISILFLFSVTAYAQEGFSDISNNSYKTAISYLQEKSIIQGYSDGTFKPEKTVNRAEFVKILVGAKLGHEPIDEARNCFLDVKAEDWFSSYTCYAKKNNIIGGYPDGSFRPANDINLAEAAKILVNSFDLQIPETDGQSVWYRSYIDAMQNKKYIPNILNDVNKKVNRAQMAEMVWRIMEKKSDQPAASFNFEVTKAGVCAIPQEAQAEDISNPNQVIGNGTPASCTSKAVVEAVARGGVITFSCGIEPMVIKINETAKIVNNSSTDIVIDGGGKITLDGQGEKRILYMNTCDQNQVWTSSHCQNQDTPRLSIQNITFINGNATGMDPDGGGAVFVRGGRVKVINTTFTNNRCDSSGPDVGGGALRVLSQYNNLPVYVVNSTFGGAENLGNECSNGGGLSSIGVSFTIINSLFSYNKAIGKGANPAKSGTPGGGNGGAIANDGNDYDLNLCGTTIQSNHANEGGGGIFFVSNDRTGHLIIKDSQLSNNPSDEFETDGFPGIFYLGSGEIQMSGSEVK